MGIAPFVLLLVVALVLSAQVLLLMERRRPLDKRLRDLGTGGDGCALLLAALLTLGATGAAIGSLLGSAGTGAAAGLALASLTWTTAVIHAHRRPQPPARHQSPRER
ncbi:hypothetical protein [Kribbella shirazensis]|uniref:Uncharacterized protein n=1 Tax=Kribbella shirazensis TaxID=1105143 RepID=A0A7X5V959_9ACTN|nr:hypothetical protein [Kribbella shirazensis]NIK56934.1 hypothetical protein [Kribbella shirazensis]